MQLSTSQRLNLPPELTLPPSEMREFNSRQYRNYSFGNLLLESETRIAGLARTNCEPAWRIAEKLSNCCLEPVVINFNSGEKYFLAEQRCKSRICPKCSTIRARSLALKIAEMVHTMDSPRFVTLSMRSTDKPLREQLRTLRTRFAAFRRSETWACYVTGGVYTIEISFNPGSQQWHPHIHAIVDGSYFPHSELLLTWERLVGDQAAVDIRQVIGVQKIARYLASYIAKSCDLEKLETDQLAEWAIETHGLRLAQTFGIYHGRKVDEEDEEPSSYRTYDLDVNFLVVQASNGQENARQLLNHLSGNRLLLPQQFEFLADQFEGREPRIGPIRPRSPDHQLQLNT